MVMADGFVVTRDVANERKRQDDKWGVQDHEHATWLTILTEEVGELAQCILHRKFGGHHADKLYEELTQVAAVAVAWMEAANDGRAR
jgi:NTP pyrophosphatase (non-canonical NTP hydrolase)